MKTPIEQVRKALEFGDHVTYADNHFAVVLNVQLEFDQYEVAYRQYDGGGHEYWKTAVCHLSDLTALKSMEGQTSTPRLTADELANEIRRVDGSNSLGAGALAEALIPFLTKSARP